jgi:hypothetical protein
MRLLRADDHRRRRVLAKVAWALAVSGASDYDDEKAERFVSSLVEQRVSEREAPWDR